MLPAASTVDTRDDYRDLAVALAYARSNNASGGSRGRMHSALAVTMYRGVGADRRSTDDYRGIEQVYREAVVRSLAWTGWYRTER